jgi:hypothetical protein
VNFLCILTRVETHLDRFSAQELSQGIGTVIASWFHEQKKSLLMLRGGVAGGF